ncbi:hypothetical protein P4O66_008001 [Electrophorus voltai]|uniref:Uncharacterized protein n=1 Tax=Electrophorus voltai TaxID=2609070 RepID=A0AAD8ZDP8_9TELE|nr:hypothetical protein P4O66_008001 [Electrophorus voltai]
MDSFSVPSRWFDMEGQLEGQLCARALRVAGDAGANSASCHPLGAGNADVRLRTPFPEQLKAHQGDGKEKETQTPTWLTELCWSRVGSRRGCPRCFVDLRPPGDMGLFLRASSTLNTSDNLVHSSTDRDAGFTLLARAAPAPARHAAQHWDTSETMRGLEAEESRSTPRANSLTESESREQTEPDGEENCCDDKSETQELRQQAAISEGCVTSRVAGKPSFSSDFLCVALGGGEGHLVPPTQHPSHFSQILDASLHTMQHSLLLPFISAVYTHFPILFSLSASHRVFRRQLSPSAVFASEAACGLVPGPTTRGLRCSIPN